MFLLSAVSKVVTRTAVGVGVLVGKPSGVPTPFGVTFGLNSRFAPALPVGVPTGVALNTSALARCGCNVEHDELTGARVEPKHHGRTTRGLGDMLSNMSS